MKKRWKIGVVGAGGISQAHLEAARKEPRLEVAAIADVATTLAEERAEEFAIPVVYSDYCELLENPKIDAVIICLPNYLHAQVALDAFSFGKHVLCEKPMAVTGQEANQMVAAAKQANRVLMVGMNNRFRPEVTLAKHSIEAGELGEIYHAKAAWIRRHGIPGWGSWFTQKAKSGGGPLIDIGVHVLDATLWLLDFPQPRYILAQSYAKFGPQQKGLSSYGTFVPDGEYDVEDTVTAMISFANGSTLTLDASWASHIEMEQTYIQLQGDLGGARIQFDPQRLSLHTDKYGLAQNAEIKLPPAQERLKLLQHFVDVLEGAEPTCTAQHGAYLNQLIDAIYESAKRGEPILFYS